jgi:hypothetical protein
MIKKIIISSALCFVINNIHAQRISYDLNSKNETENISPVVKAKIEEYSLQIHQIVVKEKDLMSEEIDKINGKLKAGEITEEVAKDEKKKISDNYSEKINSQISNLQFDLDEVTKKQVQFSILNSDSSTPETDAKSKPVKNYVSTNFINGFIGFGMINLPNGNNQNLNKHLAFNSGFDFGMLYKKQFNRTSPFQVLSGAYLSYRTLRFNDNYFMYRNESGVVDLVQYDKNLDKTKLRAGYLVLPIGLSYNTSKLSTDNLGNYRNINNGVTFGLNFYGGIRISSNNIVNGDNISFRDSNTDYNHNKYIYGLQGNISYRSFNLYLRQELSPFFSGNNLDNRKMFQIGLMLGW